MANLSVILLAFVGCAGGGLLLVGSVAVVWAVIGEARQR
jgi:hypothetical protein